MKSLNIMNKRFHFHFSIWHFLVSINQVIAVRGKLLPYQITACDDLKSSLYILLKISVLV